MIDTNERERQRFEHLVLERPRPKPATAKRARKKAARPVLLLPGIEERVQLREDWGHKKGTPETHAHAHRASQRPGSIARLFASGAIDRDQLAAAEAIESAYRAIAADVAVRTASLETRIDGGSRGGAELELLGRVKAEFAYDWWRARVEGPVDALLDVIVHDFGLTIVARRHGMSMPRARRMLGQALDLWWVGRGRTAGAARAAAG